jgi:hypothetical protein
MCPEEPAARTMINARWVRDDEDSSGGFVRHICALVGMSARI